MKSQAQQFYVNVGLWCAAPRSPTASVIESEWFGDHVVISSHFSEGNLAWALDAAEAFHRQLGEALEHGRALQAELDAKGGSR